MPDVLLYSRYFEEQVLRKRPYLRKSWCEAIVRSPIRWERQPDGRYRFWGQVPDLDGRYLRVVLLNDGRTVHNAFPDRGFVP